MAVKPAKKIKPARQHENFLIPVSLQELLVPCAVLLITLLTFLPVLRHDFTNWDDPANVMQNPVVMSPSRAGVIDAWTRPLNSMYAPLVFMSFMADAAVGGGSPRPFHLTNLMLHLAAAMAAYSIMRLLLSARLPAAAGLGALIFALHPLQAEPVAWVTGRKDVLAGFLGLLAIWLHLRAERSEAGRQTWMRLGAAAAFAISLLAKASGVALPFAVLAIQVLVEKRPLRASTLRLLPWLAVALTISLVAMAAQPMPDWIKHSAPPLRRPLLAGHALLFYAMKAVWPAGLAPVYPVNAVEAAANPLNAVYLLGALLATGAAAWRRGKPAAALCVFIAPLLPVLGFIPFLYQEISLTADRYAYVSMLGIAMSVAWVVERSWPSNRMRAAALIGFSIIAAVYGVLANHQARLWRNSETLWRHAVAVSPGVPEAHTNLAFALHHQSDDTTEAETQLELALRADRDFSMAWTLLGLMQLERIGPDAGIPSLKEAVRSLETKGYRDRRLAEARNNLGAALMRKQDFAAAEEQFRKAISIAPLGDAYANLASVLEAQGRQEEARAVYLEAAKLGVEISMEDGPKTPLP